MSFMVRSLFAIVVFLALAAGQAQAGYLTLQIAGLTIDGSLWPSGAAIIAGTPFEVQAVFPNVPVYTNLGIGEYQPTVLNAEVGGTSYLNLDASSSVMILCDPSANCFGAPIYFAGLVVGSGVFGSAYTTATPPLEATAPTPTVFSDYFGSFGNILVLSTADGPLLLGYDPAVGVDTSIITPEPGTLALFGAGFVAVWRLRRRLVYEHRSIVAGHRNRK